MNSIFFILTKFCGISLFLFFILAKDIYPNVDSKLIMILGLFFGVSSFYFEDKFSEKGFDYIISVMIYTFLIIGFNYYYYLQINLSQNDYIVFFAAGIIIASTTYEHSKGKKFLKK